MLFRYRPFFAALLFTLFVVGFYFLDYINYARAGKILITGMSTIGLLSALRIKYPHKAYLSWLLIVVSLLLFANLSFQGVLRDIFGVAQDEMMIMKAIFGTDAQESYEFWLQYKPYLIKHLALLVFSFAIFYFLVLQTSLKSQNIAISNLVFIGWVLFFTIGHLEKSIRRGSPFVYFSHFYAEWRAELEEINTLNTLLAKNIKNTMLDDTKYIGEMKKNTLVWVIGESSTKHNWSLYGYERNTTPLMDSIRDELLVFQNIKAAAPITVPAFERMLTPASITHPALWKSQPNIIQIAKKAGYHTYWISNHTTDAHNGITYIFSHQADEVYMTNQGKARGEGSYDASVLPAYKRALSDPDEKKLILVHLLGSHPAYNFRYPKAYAKFSSVFDDPTAKSLSKKALLIGPLLLETFTTTPSSMGTIYDIAY